MNTQLPHTIIFMGRSGSGKGTQVELLKTYLQGVQPNTTVLHVETGTLFRELIAQDSVTARLANNIYQSGGKKYDFLAIDLIVEFLKKNYSGAETLFFDGAPRSLSEAVLLDNMLEFYERFDSTKYTKAVVIHVDVEKEWAIDKLVKRGRSDDNEMEKIQNKMSWFDADVKPAIGYLKENPNFNFIHINGEQTVEQVHAEILSKL